MQRPARAQDAAQLAQRGLDVRDRAHGPRGERSVEAVVGERQRRAVQAGALDGDARRIQPPAGELPSGVRRLDRRHPRDGGRVERDVQARAEADLHDLAGEPLADAPALRLGHRRAAQPVEHPRQDVLGVQAHAVQPTSQRSSEILARRLRRA
jgi:hypothetical protein